MSQLTKEKAIVLAATQDVWKVHIFESERGRGSDSWDVYFDNEQEALAYVKEINKDLPEDHTPDYYMMAYPPQKVQLTLR